MTTTALPTFETFDKFTAQAAEGVSLLAAANLKTLRQLADLSTAAGPETLKLAGELQSSALVAVKQGEEFVLEQAARLPDLRKDPVETVRKGVLAGLEGAQDAFKVFETNTLTATKAVERLQESAVKAGKDIQETYAELANDLKALYTPSDLK